MRLIPGAPATGLQESDFKTETVLEEHAIVLDDLVDHGPQATLSPTGRRVFVMTAGPNHRTAVYARQRPDGWGVSQIRGEDMAVPVSQTVAMLRSTRRIDSGDLFIVEIKGMHLTLVGHREDGVLMLTPIEDRPDLNLTANVARPGASLLAGLVDEARRWATESAKSFR
jgi:hypothetical protein